MESLFRWESRIALIPTSVPGKTYLNCNVQRPAAAASSQLKFDQQSLKDTVQKPISQPDQEVCLNQVQAQ